MSAAIFGPQDIFYQNYSPPLKSRGMSHFVIQIIDDYCRYQPSSQELANRLKMIMDVEKGICTYAHFVHYVALFACPFREWALTEMQEISFVNVCKYYLKAIAVKNGYVAKFQIIENVLNDALDTPELDLARTVTVLALIKRIAVDFFNVCQSSLELHYFLTLMPEKLTNGDLSKAAVDVIDKGIGSKNVEVFSFFRRLYAFVLKMGNEKRPACFDFYYEHELLKLREILLHLQSHYPSNFGATFRILNNFHIATKEGQFAAKVDRFLSALKISTDKNCAFLKTVGFESKILKRFSAERQLALKLINSPPFKAHLKKLKPEDINQAKQFCSLYELLKARLDEWDLTYTLLHSLLGKVVCSHFGTGEQIINCNAERHLTYDEMRGFFQQLKEFYSTRVKSSKGIDDSFKVVVKKSPVSLPKIKKKKRDLQLAKEVEPTDQKANAAYVQIDQIAMPKDELAHLFAASTLDLNRIRFARRVQERLDQPAIKEGKKREDTWAHGFTTQLDRFLGTPYCYSWKGAQNEMHYAFIVVVEDQGQWHPYYATYTIKGDYCYHRCLQKRTRLELFNAMGEDQVRNLIEWPPLQQAQAQAKVRVEGRGIEKMTYDAVLGIVTVIDEKHGITIKVLPKE